MLVRLVDLVPAAKSACRSGRESAHWFDPRALGVVSNERDCVGTVQGRHGPRNTNPILNASLAPHAVPPRPAVPPAKNLCLRLRVWRPR